MAKISAEPIDSAFIQRELASLGVSHGATVVVHSSLSAFGAVHGGAQAIVDALLHGVGESGTLVVPTFTPQVSDPHPQSPSFDDPQIIRDRQSVPLFHEHLATPMGAAPNAVLAHPDCRRGRHPQASVAAIGARAREITEDQPFIYALGKDSPFEKMYRLGAYILLLGVGHNRNSFLHYAESLVPHHRTKFRRFPYMIENERVWVEVPDVGDDNGKYFPQIGAEAEAAGLIRSRMIGSARCELMECVPFVDFAKSRLEALLVGKKWCQR